MESQSQAFQEAMRAYRSGNTEEATRRLRQVVERDPDHADARHALGLLTLQAGGLEEAAALISRAVAVASDRADFYTDLGIVRQRQNRPMEAVRLHEKALALEPGLAGAHINLGHTLRTLGRLHEAAASYRRAIAQQENVPEAHNFLATALKDLKRQTLADAVAAIRDQGWTVSNPPKDVGMTNIYLAYHDLDNKGLAESIAAMHLVACPKFAYRARHCDTGKGPEKDTLVVGFVSAFFRDHTIGKLNRGLIENLSRDRFRVVLFRTPGRPDPLSERIDAAVDRVVQLTGRLESDWKIVEAEAPDILFYADIGMNAYTYFLAVARLAPVQAVTWGHPDTTGIPNLDYFVSSETLEPPGAAGHYRETLVTLPHLNFYYYKPAVPVEKTVCEDFGLPAEARLYVCPQTPYKFHPRFDHILGEILRRDPEGRLVLIDIPQGDHCRDLLKGRFARCFPDAVDRVAFFPHMPLDRFLGLCRLADALLDIPSFSGGNTTLEALAVQAPVVTLPSAFMRGRLTAAIYRQLGITELIAADEKSYIFLALRLARDKPFKRRVQRAIKTHAHKLFETAEAVRELELFFQAAHDAWRRSQTLPAG